jgi:hypothetical protein
VKNAYSSASSTSSVVLAFGETLALGIGCATHQYVRRNKIVACC